MTRVRVLRICEKRHAMEVVGFGPGVFPLDFMQEMLGQAFVRDRFADGTLVLVNEDGTSAA